MSRQPVRRVDAFASTARTATPTAYEFSMDGAIGLHCVIDVTAASDTPSVTPTIAGYDPLSGKYFTLLTGAAITATGTTVLKVGPGLAASANAAAADFCPDTIRLSMAHADSDSITYTVAFHLYE